ncbi:MAG: ribosome assembly cofactor RimP [Bacteroidales bacterium]|nr:ribosome assembly cofactor RimP [Bacteroidales bacterium]
MMDKQTILQQMEVPVQARGCFVVEVKVSADNDIELTIESAEGIVSMDDCVALSESFQALFDREIEDYSLTVTSAGLDQPFKVLRQFLKAVGTLVEVRLKGGRKITGTLTGADEGSITLRYTVREVPEGKKKKEDVLHEDSFPMEEVNSVTPHISFE